MCQGFAGVADRASIRRKVEGLIGTLEGLLWGVWFERSSIKFCGLKIVPLILK